MSSSNKKFRSPSTHLHITRLTQVYAVPKAASTKTKKQVASTSLPRRNHPGSKDRQSKDKPISRSRFTWVDPDFEIDLKHESKIDSEVIGLASQIICQAIDSIDCELYKKEYDHPHKFIHKHEFSRRKDHAANYFAIKTISIASTEIPRKYLNKGIECLAAVLDNPLQQIPYFCDVINAFFNIIKLLSNKLEQKFLQWMLHELINDVFLRPSQDYVRVEVGKPWYCREVAVIIRILFQSPELIFKSINLLKQILVPHEGESYAHFERRLRSKSEDAAIWFYQKKRVHVSAFLFNMVDKICSVHSHTKIHNVGQLIDVLIENNNQTMRSMLLAIRQEIASLNSGNFFCDESAVAKMIASEKKQEIACRYVRALITKDMNKREAVYWEIRKLVYELNPHEQDTLIRELKACGIESKEASLPPMLRIVNFSFLRIVSFLTKVSLAQKTLNSALTDPAICNFPEVLVQPISQYYHSPKAKLR